MSFLSGIVGAIGGAVGGILSGNPLAAVTGAVKGAVKGSKGGIRVPRIDANSALAFVRSRARETRAARAEEVAFRRSFSRDAAVGASAAAVGLNTAQRATIPVLVAPPPTTAAVLPSYVAAGGGAGAGPVNTFAPPLLTAQQLSKAMSVGRKKRKKKASSRSSRRRGRRRGRRGLTRAQLRAGFGGRRRM